MNLIRTTTPWETKLDFNAPIYNANAPIYNANAPIYNAWGVVNRFVGVVNWRVGVVSWRIGVVNWRVEIQTFFPRVGYVTVDRIITMELRHFSGQLLHKFSHQ